MARGRKKTKPVGPQTKLTVTLRVRCLDIHRASKQFGSWHENNDTEVSGVYLADECDAYGDNIVVPCDVQNGDTVYVLFMIYSSGDSFGNSSGNGEVMWVFKDLTLAKQALEQVKKANEFDYSVRSTPPDNLDFKLEDGSTVTVGNPPHDYFQNMTDVYLKSMSVGHGGVIR